MALIIATGTNLGDKIGNLAKARKLLGRHFQLIAASRIYSSPPVDYLDQPDFYNQVLQFDSPQFSAREVMDLLLTIEETMGRRRGVPKGPRNIDIDLIFYDDFICQTPTLTLPHPRWSERSFVALPLRELPCFPKLFTNKDFPQIFSQAATPIDGLRN